MRRQVVVGGERNGFEGFTRQKKSRSGERLFGCLARGLLLSENLDGQNGVAGDLDAVGIGVGGGDGGGSQSG